MGIADLAGDNELEAAILIVSEDMSSGACVVQMPRESSIRFESIGRDEEGGYLICEGGALVRLRADDGELDDLLGKENVLIEEMDENGHFVGAYQVTAIPFATNVGYRA